jgi:Ulp1 protease family, C-terminal catalytic domain
MALHQPQKQHSTLPLLIASEPLPQPPLITIPPPTTATSTISSLSTTHSRVIRPLLTQERLILTSIFNQPPSARRVLAQDAAMVTVRSFHTLQHGSWMDDEVLNGYLSLLTNQEIMHHNAGIILKPSMHLPTHFYTKLINPTKADPAKSGYRYANVRGWGTRLSPLSNIFHMETLFIPLHVGASHWVAILVDNSRKTIEYMDSLGWNGNQHLEHVLQYLQDEHTALFQAPLPIGPPGWRITPAPADLPL